MGRWLVWGAGVGCIAIAVAACGEEEATFDDTDGGAGASSGGSGGAAGNGSGGSATGGGAGATGGSAGSATGGSAGSATGGSAGAGGSAGSSTGGTGGASGDCPATQPPDDTSCTTPGLACCYGAAPAKPIRCVPTSADGGGPYEWQTLNSRECCPAQAPQSGEQCGTPGDLKCCYGNSGFFCNQQHNPDAWEPTSCS